VVIFYLDTTYDEENPAFRLLFEGEIMGWSYTSTPLGRMMQFNCVADISIFQSLYFFFMNTVNATIAYGAQPGADSATVATAGIHYPFSIFKKGLFVNANTSKESADIERPFDLLQNIVQGLIGATPTNTEKKTFEQRPVPAVNYYMRWVRKRNFVNRIVALPLFEDDFSDQTIGTFAILKAAQATSALDAMATSLAQSVGDQGNIYDLLAEILTTTYSELAMIPTAPCVVVRAEDGTILRPAELGPSAPELTAEEPLRLVNYFIKPQMLFGIPPACNVIFPSMISNYTYTEQYWAQPTRVYVNDEFFNSALKPTPLVAAATTVGYPEEINTVLQARQGRGDDAAQRRITGKNVLVFPEEFFKGPVVARMPVPRWFTYLVNQAATVNKSPAQTVAAGKEAPTPENLQSLFFLYSQYEYYRRRYEQRGGAVDMTWNPYPIPGFPCYVFDHRRSALDTAGYIMNIQHSLDASGGGTMSTSLNYSFGRTINELLDTMKIDMNRLGIVLGSAPVDPVDGVRRISQNFGKAEDYYNALLFGRKQLVNKKASADIRDLVAFVADHDDAHYGDDPVLDPLVIEGDAEIDVPFAGNDARSRPLPKTNFGATGELSDNAPGGSRDVEATEGFERIFANGIEALKYVSRPICTLQEYLVFIGGKPLAQLLDEGIVTGERHEYSYQELVGGSNVDKPRSSAVFYEQIKKLRPGPGERPPLSQTGAELRTVHTGKLDPLPGEFPQTRLNWNEILLAYRQDVIDQPAPQG
jgi:hypothetical protein